MLALLGHKQCSMGYRPQWLYLLLYLLLQIHTVFLMEWCRMSIADESLTISDLYSEINSACPRIFKSSNWILKSQLKGSNTGLKIRKEKFKVDMIFQSSIVKTELIFVFEFSIQFFNIPFQYYNGQSDL